MLEKKCVRFIQMLGVIALAACQTGPAQTENQAPEAVVESAAPAEAMASLETEPVAAEPVAAPPVAAYQEAINLASGAVTLRQQATSSDDWDLIVGRWQQAIEKLKQVPATDQNHAMAQTKLQEYQRNLAQAQQRLKQLKQPPAEIALPRSSSSPRLAAAPAPAAPAASARIPIIERRGGTPVVEVKFNGKPYPMILDTGASHTHITRAMANELGVQVMGQTSVATASSSQAIVDVGYVPSVSVGNISRTDLPVSIGDAVPIGLLGNDVFKDYDVTLQANSVEFRLR